jgi:cytoskeletal protein CcmA (bactofilin family)
MPGLFARDSRGSPHEAIETVVGPTADVRGTLRSDGGLRIDGIFEGVIEAAGNVVIGEGARVVADITGRNITVGGAVKGNVDGTGRLEILSTGAVYGDICVASVMIDEGGVFQGTSRMRGHEQRALIPPTDEAAPPAGVTEPETRTVIEEAIDVTARPVSPPGDELGLDEIDIEPIIPGSGPENGRDEGGSAVHRPRRPSSRSRGSTSVPG